MNKQRTKQNAKRYRHELAALRSRIEAGSSLPAAARQIGADFQLTRFAEREVLETYTAQTTTTTPTRAPRSFHHHVYVMGSGRYRLTWEAKSWNVNNHQLSQLSREATREAAERFCKRWGCRMPDAT